MIFCTISFPILQFFCTHLTNFMIVWWILQFPPSETHLTSFSRPFDNDICPKTIWRISWRILQDSSDWYWWFFWGGRGVGHLTNFVIFILRIFDEFQNSFYQDLVINLVICLLREFDELSYFFLKNIWWILWIFSPRSFCEFRYSSAKSLCDFCDFLLRLLDEFRDFFPHDYLINFEIWEIFPQQIGEIHSFFSTDWHSLKKMHCADGVKSYSVCLCIQNIYVKRKNFYFIRCLFLHCSLFSLFFSRVA